MSLRPDQDEPEWRPPPVRSGPKDVVPLLLVAVLVAVAVCTAGLLISRTDAERHETLSARIVTRHTLAAQFVAAYIDGVVGREQVLAEVALSGSVTPEDFERLMLENGFGPSILLEADGTVLAVNPAAPALLGKPLAVPFAHLERALEGLPAVSNVVLSAAEREPIVAFAVPFETADGQRRVFSVGHPPGDTSLTSFASNALSLANSRALLVDVDGIIIASSEADLRPGADLNQWPELAAAADQTGYHEVGGVETYAVAGPVEGTEWRLVFTVETSALFAPVSGPARLVPWGILVAFTAASVAALALWRRAHREHRARLGYERQLHEQAMSDSLTGLANRRVAVDRLTQALSRAQRMPTSVAVVFIDIDHFKAINDGFGHAAGDAVLVAVADRLRTTYRNEDTVARLGGDEFLVICEDMTDLEAVEAIVARTRTALAVPYVVGDLLVPGSASVGVTTAAAGETPETVLARADRQMYNAKATRELIDVVLTVAGTPVAVGPT